MIVLEKLNFKFWFFVFAAIPILLILRNTGMYPVIFADEYVWSRDSRLVALSFVSVPAYLFLSIYRTTNLCGNGFLECARFLNLLFS